jgi:hypothetical protein
LTAFLVHNSETQGFQVKSLNEYSMKRRLRAVFWFLFSLMILGVSTLPGYRVVDRVLLSGMGVLLLILSVLKIQDIWKSRGNPEVRESKGMIGQLYLFPRSWQRWILDERDGDERGKPQSK